MNSVRASPSGSTPRAPASEETTLGCLEWEWRVAQRERLSAYEFAVHVLELDRALQQTGFSAAALERFFKGLPEATQKEIFKGMEVHRLAEEWKGDLGDPGTVWFRLFTRWARRWNSQAFDEQSRANVGKDWTLALPLLTNHLRRQEFTEARKLALEAIHSLLRLAPGESFDPRRRLLVESVGSWRPLSDAGKAFRVLAAWQKAAAALGEDVRDALALQCSIGLRWREPDAVLSAFAAAGGQQDALFAEWRSMIADASWSWHRYLPSEDWVPALVDSARAGDQGALFERSVRTFLAGFRAKADAPTASLAALVLDLDHEGTFPRRFPKLAGLFRERVGGRDDSLARWRRKQMQSWNRPGLLADVLDSVQSNIEAFVPEPMGGRYEDCARWAAAVREFDTRAFSALTARWAVKHRLKRNLWSALRRVGLGELPR